jgi:hypothetical protein
MTRHPKSPVTCLSPSIVRRVGLPSNLWPLVVSRGGQPLAEKGAAMQLIESSARAPAFALLMHLACRRMRSCGCPRHSHGGLLSGGLPDPIPGALPTTRPLTRHGFVQVKGFSGDPVRPRKKNPNAQSCRRTGGLVRCRRPRAAPASPGRRNGHLHGGRSSDRGRGGIADGTEAGLVTQTPTNLRSSS